MSLRVFLPQLVQAFHVKNRYSGGRSQFLQSAFYLVTYSALSFSLLLGVAASAWAQTEPLPQIRRNGAVKQFFVDNKPFIMLSGELHNSSASSVEYMKPIWNKLAAMHLNSVVSTVSWELIEPEEGKFDFSSVDAQITPFLSRSVFATSHPL